MPITIPKSAVNNIVVETKDFRSESIDSCSSTIDVHANDPPKRQPKSDAKDSLSPKQRSRFGLAYNCGNKADSPFDVILPSPITYQEQHLIQQALSSILVLQSPACPEVQTLLSAYRGHLVTNLGHRLLEELCDAAPDRLAARVGDFNENLFYEMRNVDQSVGSIVRHSNGSWDCEEDDPTMLQRDIDSFERSLRLALQCTHLSYRGSYMQTERTAYQPAHVDYDYTLLERYSQRLFLAFFPLTEEGAFLQLWQDHSGMSDCSIDEEKKQQQERLQQEGTVVYIPYGSMLILPSDTVHGGGFKRGAGGNRRFHLYIEVEDAEDETSKKEDQEGERGETQERVALLERPVNKYTEKYDRRRELCERFVDAKGLDALLGTFFDG